MPLKIRPNAIEQEEGDFIFPAILSQIGQGDFLFDVNGVTGSALIKHYNNLSGFASPVTIMGSAVHLIANDGSVGLRLQEGGGFGKFMINPTAKDYDLEYLADDGTMLLFGDAGGARIGVGTSVPTGIFHAAGSLGSWHIDDDGSALFGNRAGHNYFGALDSDGSLWLTAGGDFTSPSFFIDKNNHVILGETIHPTGGTVSAFEKTWVAKENDFSSLSLASIVSGSLALNALTGYASRGAIISPYPTEEGDYFLYIGGRGHDGSAWRTTAAGIILQATEYWNVSGRGADLKFLGTLTGTTARIELLRLSDEILFNSESKAIPLRYQSQGAPNAFSILASGGYAAFNAVPTEGPILTLGGYQDYQEQGSFPATPPSGYGRFIARDDGHVYWKNDSGEVFILTSGTAGPAGESLWSETGTLAYYDDGVVAVGTSVLDNFESLIISNKDKTAGTGTYDSSWLDEYTGMVLGATPDDAGCLYLLALRGNTDDVYNNIGTNIYWNPHAGDISWHQRDPSKHSLTYEQKVTPDDGWHNFWWTRTGSATLYSLLSMGGSEIRFNQVGRDVDYIVQSDEEESALFIRGSDAFVGLGTNETPHPRNRLFLRDSRTSGLHANITAYTNALIGGTGSAETLSIDSIDYNAYGGWHFGLISINAQFDPTADSWSRFDDSMGAVNVALQADQGDGLPEFIVKTWATGTSAWLPQLALKPGRVLISDQFDYYDDFTPLAVRSQQDYSMINPDDGWGAFSSLKVMTSGSAPMLASIQAGRASINSPFFGAFTANVAIHPQSGTWNRANDTYGGAILQSEHTKEHTRGAFWIMGHDESFHQMYEFHIPSGTSAQKTLRFNPLSEDIDFIVYDDSGEALRVDGALGNTILPDDKYIQLGQFTTGSAAWPAEPSANNWIIFGQDMADSFDGITPYFRGYGAGPWEYPQPLVSRGYEDYRVTDSWHAFGDSAYYIAGQVNATALTSGAPAINEIHFIPFFVNQRFVVTKLGFYVTVAGSAGSVARVGIYNNKRIRDSGPNNLLYDGGEKSTTSTGAKETTGLSVELVPGMYWFAYHPGVAAPTIRCLAAGAIFPNWGLSSLSNTNIQVGRIGDSTYGALPALGYGLAGSALSTTDPIPAIYFTLN